MGPEQGNEMLFIGREANLDLRLVAETLYSSRADLISRHKARPSRKVGAARAKASSGDTNSEAVQIPINPPVLR